MYQYQKDLFDKIISGGIKPGEMMIMSSGRQTGKSLLNAAYGRLMQDLANRPIEELVLGETPIHGARYYCVEPIGGNWPEMEKWAKTVYGEPGEIWPLKGEDDFGWPECSRWFMNNRKFWFRNEKDRTLFILKWRT